MRGKICLVDHDLKSSDFLRECLENKGHQVVILKNGFLLKPYLSHEHFNLFILNLATPGIREKGLLFDIHQFHPSKILLIISERGDPFPKEAIDLGVYGFIYKPFNLKEVYTMVNHLTR